MSMNCRVGRILGCARKHGVSVKDIETASKFACAVRYRNYDCPAHIAFAGPDSSGKLIEILAAEQLDGSLIVYHAMKLTRKMAVELGLL